MPLKFTITLFIVSLLLALSVNANERIIVRDYRSSQPDRVNQHPQSGQPRPTIVSRRARPATIDNQRGLHDIVNQISSYKKWMIGANNKRAIDAEIANRIAADNALQNNIDTITLTPGPKGDKGDQGIKGETGAAGPAGSDDVLRADVCVLYETLNAAYSLGLDIPNYCSPSNPNNNYIFVSSIKYPNADFGGLAGADAKCQELATSAGHDGTYRALLSTSNISARDRLSIRFPLSLVNGPIIAEDTNDMWDGNVPALINVTELGTRANWHLAVTGTDSDGMADRGLFATWCGDWHSATGGVETGRTDRQDFGWLAIYGNTSSQSSNSCSNETLLYCLRTIQ